MGKIVLFLFRSRTVGLLRGDVDWRWFMVVCTRRGVARSRGFYM